MEEIVLVVMPMEVVPWIVVWVLVVLVLMVDI